MLNLNDLCIEFLQSPAAVSEQTIERRDDVAVMLQEDLLKARPWPQLFTHRAFRFLDDRWQGYESPCNSLSQQGFLDSSRSFMKYTIAVSEK